MIVRAVNEAHIREMLHAIGLDYKKPKRGKYEAYRNYYCCYTENYIWEHLVSIGYAKCNVRVQENMMHKTTYNYYLTEDGLSFIGNITGCEITLAK